MNLSDAGVVEIRRMFHAAVAAFHNPGASPTRGSGLGALADMSGVGAGPPAIETDAGDVAQPPIAESAARTMKERDDAGVTVTPVRCDGSAGEEARGASRLPHLTAHPHGSATGRASTRQNALSRVP